MRPVILAFSVLAISATASTAEAKSHHRHHHRHSAHHTHTNSTNIKTVQTEAGPIRVAAAYAERFVGFINALVESGYKPKDIGCLSRGHMPNSKHHWGGACDIDQKSRNVTAKRMYHVTELAHEYNLEDGCEWRNPDCGHIEVPGSNHYARHHRRHYAKAE